MSDGLCYSSQNETILVKNYMNIPVFGENCLPFSWRIKDYLEDIWTQAQHIESAEGIIQPVYFKWYIKLPCNLKSPLNCDVKYCQNICTWVQLK